MKKITDLLKNRQRLGAWAGMAGSVLFVAVFWIEGWLRPGYQAHAMLVSELSLGPRGWVQIANFMVTGALLLLFCRGAAAAFIRSRLQKAGCMIMAAIGAGLLVSGPLVMDPVHTPLGLMRWQGFAHQLIGALVFVLMPACCFVFFCIFGKHRDWRCLRWPTLAAGLVLTVFLGFMRIAQDQYLQAYPFTEYIGYIQRGALMMFMAWMFAFSLRLYRIGARQPAD